MNGARVLAVDGGNSKTDLALVAADGALLALVRGPSSSPHQIGLDGALGVLEELLEEAARDAGLDPRARPLVDVGEVLMAGADLPDEERELGAALSARRFADRAYHANDTFAVLRSGTERGWGVAVVIGAGINCVGVAPDGRHARFPSLGATTGDWGGGYDIGVAGLFAAARSEDGRGPLTTLERAVPAYFGLETPGDLAEAIHVGRISMRRLTELGPLVLAAAADDPVAGEILDRLAAEAVAMATVAMRRLDLLDEPVDVVLGGGVVRFGPARLVQAVSDGVAALAPAASVHAVSTPPIAGAALLGLDRLAVPAEAKHRARAELEAAVDRLAADSGAEQEAGSRG